MKMSGDFMKDFGLNNSATSSSTENNVPSDPITLNTVEPEL